jgi:hypothetical protein
MICIAEDIFDDVFKVLVVLLLLSGKAGSRRHCLVLGSGVKQWELIYYGVVRRFVVTAFQIFLKRGKKAEVSERHTKLM